MVGDYLFTGSDFVSNLSTNHRNVFQKVYDEIKYLCKVATAGSKEAWQLEKVKKVFEDAYRADAPKNNDDGVKYSLRAFEQDGRRFVEIDQEQHRFDGHSEDEYPRIAKDIINEKFNGKIIGIDNKMFVNGAGRDEFANPSKRISEDIYEAKMRSAGELDNLLDAGTNYRNVPDGADGHYHPDVIGGFDHLDTLFKIGNRYYAAVVNIKNVRNGKLFKDVTKIKDVTQDIMSSYGENPKSQFLRTSSTNSIRNSDGIVNSKKSLSFDNIPIRSDLPTQHGSYAVSGRDIALDDDIPIRDDLPAAGRADESQSVSNHNVLGDDTPIRDDIAAPSEHKAAKGKLRKWIKTSTESDAVGGAILPEDLDQSKITYTPVSNKKTLS